MTDPVQNQNLLTLREDKNAQQICILYEYHRKTDITAAFNNFCDFFGENAMEFREFEFLFYQLGKENAELGSELRFDPKSLQLMELPDDMLSEIFDYVKPIELFPIRKMSRRLRDVIDSRAPGFKKIYFRIEHFRFIMNFDYDIEGVGYFREDGADDGFTIEYKEHETLVAKGCPVEAGLSDLYQIMKNPKLSLQVLEITFGYTLRDDKYIELVENMLKKLKSIRVKKVMLCGANGDTIDHILPYLEPGKLEDIIFYRNTMDAKCDSVVKTEQFKLAKRFFMDRGSELSKETSLDNFFHLEEFTVSVEVFTKQDAMNIKNILMKKPGFKSAQIYGEMPDPMEILKVFHPTWSTPLPPGVCFETQGFKFLINFSLEFNHNINIAKV